MATAFEVLAEPTRRRILDLLCQGERSVGDLVDQLGVSQPGVSKHLKVLRDAGLVRGRVDGRRRLYRVDSEGLERLRRELDAYWGPALEALKDAAEAGGPR